MKYQHVVNNISKLMEFRGLNINELSKESGVSLTGLKKMMETGLFKIESLERIGNVFNVPVFILIADEIVIEKKETGEGYMITITYRFKESQTYQVLNDGKKLTTQFLEKGNSFGIDEAKFREMEVRLQIMGVGIERYEETIAHLNDKVNFYKEQSETLKNIIQSWFDKTPKNPE